MLALLVVFTGIRIYIYIIIICGQNSECDTYSIDYYYYYYYYNSLPTRANVDLCFIIILLYVEN